MKLDRMLKFAGVCGATGLLFGQCPLYAAPRSLKVMNDGSVVENAAVTTSAIYPPLDLADMRLWNYSAKWHASEWANASSTIPWRYNRVVQSGGTDTRFTLNESGAPQLQAVNGTVAYAKGTWSTEVTLPQFRDGVIVAPLWLYDQASRDEIDFEFAGRNGLDVSIHTLVNGVRVTKTVRVIKGASLSGARVRFSIKLDTLAGTTEMLVNGALVHRFDAGTLGYFTKKPMKPFIEMWAANPSNAGFVSWAGTFRKFTADESMVMTVHGYQYSAT